MNDRWEGEYMRFSQDILKRLSDLPVHSGILIQDEQKASITCILKLPQQVMVSNKGTYPVSISHVVDNSYATLAFQEGSAPFSLLIYFRNSLGGSTVLGRHIWEDTFSCPLDLRLEEAQHLFRILLSSGSLALILVADNQEHTVLLRHDALLESEEQEKMAHSVGNLMLLARGVNATWTNTALIERNMSESATKSEVSGLANYTHRVRSLHVRQYTFTTYHHLSPLTVQEQELAKVLATMTHEMDIATCKHIRHPHLTPLMARLIEEQLRYPIILPSTLPATHVWLDAPSTYARDIRRASGALFSSPKLAYAQAQPTWSWYGQVAAERVLHKHIQQLGDAWRLDVIDRHGFPFLRLVYLPERAIWMFSSTHQCPEKKCTFRAKQGADRLFGELSVLPCPQCKRELDWWQRYASAALPIAVEELRAEDQERSWGARYDGHIPALPQPSPRPRPQVDLLQALPADIHYALYPLILSIQRSRAFMGIPLLESRVQREASLELLIVCKLPPQFPYLKSSITLGRPEAHTYRPQGALVSFPLLLQTALPSVTTVACLFSPLDEKDVQYLEHLSVYSTGRIRFIAISDEEEPKLLGQHWLAWNSDIQRLVKAALVHVKYQKQGTPGAAKARWWRDHHNDLNKRLSLARPTPECGPQRTGSDDPLPSHMTPKTLLEQYLAYLVQQKTVSDEMKAKAVESLKKTYDCRVDSKTLDMLHLLIAKQTAPLRGKLFTFGATRVWFQFPTPIFSTFGKTALEITALWFTRETTTSSLIRWSCVLVNAGAQPLKITYSYVPSRNPIWTGAEGYQCPDHLCQRALGSDTEEDIWLFCAECERSISFWATAVHVLLRMLRGDYRVRNDEEECDYPLFEIDEEQVTDKRIARTPNGSWTATPNTRIVHVLRTIDAAVQLASPLRGVIGPRPSWLSILQKIRPDLIETEEVMARGSVCQSYHKFAASGA